MTKAPESYPYDTHLDVLNGPLEVIDVPALAATVTHPWFNQTLCKVNSSVVRVGIVMRNLQRDRPAFNKVWADRFGDHRPARSAIQSEQFGRKGENAKVMIEATAYRG